MDHDRTALVQAIALIIWGSSSLGTASDAEENAISWQPGKSVDGGGRVILHDLFLLSSVSCPYGIMSLYKREWFEA